MEDKFAELKKYSDWMSTFKRKIVDFHESIWDGNVEDTFYKDFKPFRENRTELEDGTMYLTIRCGLNGIYSFLNVWKEGRWGAECLDGSTTIAYRELKAEEKYNG